ncbi:MAG: hypothetical protein FWE94_03990, partial [Coriobacteriia bacterium]|nr:hypothetical protein [Coriobacteriia bacterium]
MQFTSRIVTRALSVVLSVTLAFTSITFVPAPAFSVPHEQAVQDADVGAQAAQPGGASSVLLPGWASALASAIKSLNPFVPEEAYAAPPGQAAKDDTHAEEGAQGAHARKDVQGSSTPDAPRSSWSLRSFLSGIWSSVFKAPAAPAASAAVTLVPMTLESLAPGREVIGEITKNRTPFSREYQLANGSIKAQYSSMPLNYVDPATGDLEPIDTALERAEGEGSGGQASWVNAANAFTLTLPDMLSAGSVSIEASGTSLSMRPVSSARTGSARASKGAVSARSDSGLKLSYPQAFIGSTLEYESVPSGLKETIMLDRAPKDGTHIWEFELGLDGLVPTMQEDGSVTFTKRGSDDVVFTVPAPYMEDSARPKAPGSASTAVHYELSGITSSGCTLSVVADSTWLSDPSRVYPVRIDPTVEYQADSWEATTATISSAPGWEDTNTYNQGLNYMWASNDYSPGIAEYAYVQPPDFFYYDLGIKHQYSNLYAVDSMLWVYPLTVDSAGIVNAEMCDGDVSIEAITWNTHLGGEGGVTSDYAAYGLDLNGPSLGGNHYDYGFDVSGMVAYWQDNYLYYGPGPATVRISAEHGTYAEFAAGNDYHSPIWEVEYAADPYTPPPVPAPVVTVTSPPANAQTTQSPTVGWSYSHASGYAQAAYEVEVAASANGTAIASASGSGSYHTSAPIPVPQGGFISGATYYVRVRAACNLVLSGGPLYWGGWATSAFVPVAPGQASVIAPSGTVATMTPTASWTYAQANSLPQTAWEVEVATSTAGAAIAY